MKLGIDLGTRNIVIAIENRGVILCEPTIMALDKKSNKILAIGDKAKEILGKTDPDICSLYPIRDGVIADYDGTEILLTHFINKACGKIRLFKPEVVISVPGRITTIEERAIKEAALSAGAKDVFLMPSPLAAAIGAEVPIDKAAGNMVIDMGAGATDLGIISLRNLVLSETIKTGGNKMDENIVRYVRRVYNIVIGKRTAEEIKIKIGSAIPLDKPLSMEVKGRDLIDNLPKSVTITDEEIREILEETIGIIIEGIKKFLEKTPPELVGDIIDTGILLTGGGARLRGLDERLNREIGVSIYVPEDVTGCIAKGTAQAQFKRD